MRTTIELPNTLRARLLELAARRGEKGFSGIVREAIESYLYGLDARETARRRAAESLGSLTEDEGMRLEEAARRLRERWR